MDDRELEARLSAHLHRRLDAAQPTPELMASVRQAFATRPWRPGLAGVWVRSPMRVGFSLTVAAVAVVIVAVAASSLGLRLGPETGGRSSPSPTAGPVERTFIVLPPTSDTPAKPEAIVAGDVLSARLRALGVGNFTMSGGYGMTFVLLDPAGPTDDEIRAALAAPGVVQFVPIPAGGPAVIEGQPLPSPGPALFGSEGIARVADATDQGGHPALNLDLTPAAAAAFAEFTSNHIGEQLAILVDGRVATAPIIQGPITGGTLQIANESSAGGLAVGAPLRAILIGGALPMAWRGAPVPTLIPREAAVASALAQPGAIEVVRAQVDAETVDGTWRAVWNVTVGGSFPDFPCTSESPSPCPIAGIEVVKIDAVEGSVMGREPGGVTP